MTLAIVIGLIAWSLLSVVCAFGLGRVLSLQRADRIDMRHFEDAVTADQD